MTKGEVKRFCIENAGKMATGVRNGTATYFSGRITGFTIDTDNVAWISLEDTSLKKKDIPNPLPEIPYYRHGWYCVLSDCHSGRVVRANTVRLLETQVSVKNEDGKVIGTLKEITKEICHKDCDPGWCHLKYVGLI